MGSGLQAIPVPVSDDAFAFSLKCRSSTAPHGHPPDEFLSFTGVILLLPVPVVPMSNIGWFPFASPEEVLCYVQGQCICF